MNKKDIEKAKKWCEEARKLLKLKGTLGGYDETADSKELLRAMESVAAELKEMKAKHKEIKNKDIQGQYGSKIETHEKEFVRLAGIAHEASEIKNLQLVRTVTAQLQFLYTQMTLKDETELKNASEKMKSKVYAQYDLSRKAADGLLSELKAKASSDHVFVGKVPEIINQVTNPVVKAQTTDAGALVKLYLTAITEFEKVKPEYDTQIKRSELFGEFSTKCKEAEFEILLVKSALKLEQGVQNMNLSMAESAVRNANAAAGKPNFDYAGAIKVLGKVHEECKQVKKSDSFDSDGFSKTSKLVQSIESKIVEFDKKLELAEQAYLNSNSLFGAITGINEVLTLLEEAKKLIKDAREKKDLAKSWLDTDPRQYNNASTLLDVALENLKTATKDKIPEAIKASDKAKKVAKVIGGPQVLQWQILLVEAQRALEEMRQWIGVTSEVENLELLIEDASKIVDPKDKRRDYAAAILKLSPFPEIVKTAKNKQPSPQLEMYKYPEFLNIRKQIRNELDLKQNLVESYFANSYNSELDDLMNLLDINADLAIAQIRELQVRLTKELKDLNEQFETARKSLVDYLSEKTTYEKVPLHAKEGAVQLGALANERFEKRDWNAASRLYKEAIESFKKLAQDKDKLIQDGATWDQKNKELSEMIKFAVPCLKWPALALTSGSFIESIRELRTTFDSTKDYKFFLEEYVKIEVAYGELQKQAEKQNLPKVPETLKSLMDAVKKVRDAAEEQIDVARSKAYRGLCELEQSLTAALDPMDNPYRKAYTQLTDGWKSQPDIEASPLPDLTGASKERIQEAVNTAVAELEKKINILRDSLVKKFGDLLVMIQKVDRAELSKKVVEEQQKNFDKDPERRITVYLTKLAGFGIDISEHVKSRDVAYKEYDLELRQPLLEQLADKLKKLVDFEIGEATKRMQLCEQKGKEAREKMRIAEELLESNFLKFKSAGVLWVTSYEEYKKSLQTQFKDVEALLDSDDPELVDLAVEQFEDLRKGILAVAPGKKPSYTDVHKRHKLLAQLLGVESDRVVIKYLKDTHARLSGKLDGAFAKALKSSPEDGLKLLGLSLEKEIRDAIALAKERKLERVRVDERIAVLTNRWTEIKKLTKTWVTEKTDSFAGFFDTCIETAHIQRKEENGGFDKANKTLDKLQKELDDITADDGKDPRTKLIEKDSKIATNERDVKEMARQFENEAKAFKEIKLKQVTDLFSEKAKTKATSKESDIEIAEGKKITEGMSKRVSEAKKLAGKMSKDPNVAQQQLAAAREILREQEAIVRRLMMQTQSTNVNLTKNLPVVLKNWKDKVGFYGTAIQEFASKVEKLPNEDGLGIDKVQAEKAAGVIRSLRGQFSVSAFDKPLDRLINEKEPEARRQAREEALLVMRSQRDNLLKNPVLNELAHNPIDRDSMMAALGYLRHALKSIEIEVLVGA